MTTLHILKTVGGFTINETSQAYNFQPYIIDEEGTEVPYQILDETNVFVGTDRGIIVLNTDCSIDDVLYANTQEFIAALYQ